MAITSSGAISLNDLHVEAGGTSGTACGFDDADIRDILEKSAGASHALGDYYSKKAPFTITLTSGGTTQFLPSNEYNVDRNKRFRGFALGQYNSNWPSSSAYGSISSHTDSDYLNNNQLITQACASGEIAATVTTTITGFATVVVRVRNISGSANNINSDASFKSININGTILNRSDSTYGDGGVGGIPSDWQWTVSNQSIPANDTSAMAMYPASGSTCTVKFRGQ